MNTNDTNVQPSSSKPLLIWIGLGIVALLIIGLIIQQTKYLPFGNRSDNEQLLTDEEIQAEIDKLRDELEKQPFVFELVSDALEAIKLPPPPESSAEDAELYQAIKTQAEGVTAEDVTNDTIYNFPSPDGGLYGNYINNSEYQFVLYQLHDEIRQLIVHFNDEYKREPLSKRIEGVTQIGEIEEALFGKPETAAVYPNVRSAEAFLVGYVLSYIDPENKDMYLRIAEEHAERGIAYGHYGKSDMEASRSLVNQYLSLVFNNYPDGLNTLIPQEDTN